MAEIGYRPATFPSLLPSSDPACLNESQEQAGENGRQKQRASFTSCTTWPRRWRPSDVRASRGIICWSCTGVVLVEVGEEGSSACGLL